MIWVLTILLELIRILIWSWVLKNQTRWAAKYWQVILTLQFAVKYAPVGTVHANNKMTLLDFKFRKNVSRKLPRKSEKTQKLLRLPVFPTVPQIAQCWHSLLLSLPVLVLLVPSLSVRWIMIYLKFSKDPNSDNIFQGHFGFSYLILLYSQIIMNGVSTNKNSTKLETKSTFRSLRALFSSPLFEGLQLVPICRNVLLCFNLSMHFSSLISSETEKKTWLSAVSSTGSNSLKTIP